MLLGFIGGLYLQSCVDTDRKQSSSSEEVNTEVVKKERKTTIQLLKEAGWTEYCTVRATNTSARSVHDNFQRVFVILYKDNLYAAIQDSEKYDEHSANYSPCLLRASKGTFRVPEDDGYRTYTGRVIWGDGTHFYFDF